MTSSVPSDDPSNPSEPSDHEESKVVDNSNSMVFGHFGSTVPLERASDKEIHDIAVEDSYKSSYVSDDEMSREKEQIFDMYDNEADQEPVASPVVKGRKKTLLG